MKASYGRQGIATILAASLLAVGAYAQDGAETEVNITEKTTTQVTSTAEVKPAAKPVKPQIVDRDPFVNQLLTGGVSAQPIGTRATNRSSVRAVTTNSGSSVAAASARVDSSLSDTEEPVEVEIPAPDVTVSGIVSSGSGRQAIISTNVGTRMITPGQKLGDYRVSAIGPDYVSFTYGGVKTFKVEIDSEFGNK